MKKNKESKSREVRRWGNVQDEVRDVFRMQTVSLAMEAGTMVGVLVVGMSGREGG